MNAMKIERTALEVDLNKIARNAERIRQLLPAGCRLMAVVKADAYGHGIVPTAFALRERVDAFAVATLEEALAVRSACKEKAILLFSMLTMPDSIVTAAENDITLNICSFSYATYIDSVLSEHKLQIKGHIEIDTGMGRTGIKVREGEIASAVASLASLYTLEYVRLKGIFTHMPCGSAKSGTGAAFSQRQFRLFLSLCNALQNRGIDIGIRHIASSEGFLVNDAYCLDMIRTGMLLYGQGPDINIIKRMKFESAATWYARIAAIHDIKVGDSVGYNRTFVADAPKRIAVINVGYADGYPIHLANLGVVSICGKRAPICGRICMDYIMVDVTAIPEATEGMMAILLGGSGESTIYHNELSSLIPPATTGFLTSSIGQRVRRIYR